MRYDGGPGRQTIGECNEFLQEVYKSLETGLEGGKVEELPVRCAKSINVTAEAGDDARACANWIKLEWNEGVASAN